MMTDNDHVEYFPGSTEIVPAVLTPLEAARFLRLDTLTRVDDDGQLVQLHRADADAVKSLEHLCRTGRLQPLKLGKSKTYARADLFNLISGSEAS